MHALIGEIGEAASYLRNDFEFENQYPDIDWFAMAGLRNIIAHDYDAVDMELIWQVVHQDLPKLKKFIEKNFSSKRSWCESGGEFQCPGPEYLQQKAGQKADDDEEPVPQPGQCPENRFIFTKKAQPQFHWPRSKQWPRWLVGLKQTAPD